MTRPRASRPLARCGGCPPPHRDRVESSSEAVPSIDSHDLTAQYNRPCAAGTRGALGVPSCRRMLGRDASSEDVRTQLVKEHPSLTSTSACRTDPSAREQPVSRRAARFRRLHESRRRRLVPASCSWGGFWRSGSPDCECALRRVTRCQPPRPASSGARVNGPALHGIRSAFVRTSVRLRATPDDYLLIEMKPEHTRE